MTSLLMCLLVAQITFSEGQTVKLQVEPFRFEQVIPLADKLLICNGEKSLVHVFDLTGKELGRLGPGSGENAMQVPSSANWLEEQQQYYVYDSGQRCFFSYSADFQFVAKLATDFPLFFESGPLHEVKDGFIAAVSLQDDRYLVGQFNKTFDSTNFAYDLVESKLADLSPVLFRTFVARSDMYDGTRILAVQALATEVTLFTPELKRMGRVSLAVPGWKRPDYGKLAKVSKNPRELERTMAEYSEIASMHVIQGSLFAIGFRNILNNPGYTFQCYDASTGNALGQTYSTPQDPIGAGFGRIYLHNALNPMELLAVTIK